MPHLQRENNTGMENIPANYVEIVCHLSITFLCKNKRFTRNKNILDIKVSLSALLTFSREQNELIFLLLPK